MSPINNHKALRGTFKSNNQHGMHLQSHAPPALLEARDRRTLLKKSKRMASSLRPYTESTAKKPLAGSMKKQRKPCTTQVLTQMCVPPQSNSASSCVAPSSGDCRKKSYLQKCKDIPYCHSKAQLPQLRKQAVKACLLCPALVT